jgi:hypothetical protein
MMQILAEKKSFNIVLFVLLGITFWFTGVLFVRLGGGALFIQGSPWVLFLFALAIPVSWVFVKISAAVGQVHGPELLAALVLETSTATLIDGAVLTWFQTVYSHEQSTLLLIAAWLLWGGGMGLAVGYLESLRGLPQKT